MKTIRKVTPEEKYYAQMLHRYGVSVKEIAAEIDRSYSAVYRWVNPEQALKHGLEAAAWRKANRRKMNEYNKKHQKTEKGIASTRRYQKSDKRKAVKQRYDSSEKGLAKNRKNQAIRRQYKQGIPEQVFIDNQWHPVDRSATWNVFKDVLIPEAEYNAIEALYAQAQEQSTDDVKYHVDHIKPLAKGGEHKLYNLRLLQDWENLSKSTAYGDDEIYLIGQRLFFSDEFVIPV